ncbi:MAG TPA: DUF1801 domain-containing protein [Candidatus Limnocylindria bacterium]|jgi:hypothetical protein|nr:DUF1801 domain-containing protein [Candidatus Limnocylindria bacterium]
MAVRKATAKKTGAKKPAPSGRKDAADAYLAQQSPEQRALLEKLRALVVKGVPDATASIKWGVPFYQRNGKNICALASFKEHVGINFFAPPEALVDPKRRLEGSGKGNRMLKVRTATDIDSASILRWLKAAASS